MHKLLSIIALWIISFGLYAQDATLKKQLDSINKWRNLASNKEVSLKTRISFANKAVRLSNKIAVDSTILNSNNLLADLYLYDVKYFNETKKILNKNLKLAHKLKDSFAAGHVNYLLGCLYHNNRIKSDSSYYHYYNALKLFKNKKRKKTSNYILSQSNTLLSLAYLQKDDQDYIGSQSTIIQGINVVLTCQENEACLTILSYLYELLGLNLDHLKEYEKAIEYYQKALQVGNRPNTIYTKINIAVVYKEIGNYQKVFEIYNKLLENKTLFKTDPASYATILNNMAYTMYLNKDKNITKIDALFTKAHNIFNDLNLKYELAASCNDMSDFYAAINWKDKVLFYSEKGYKISKGIYEYEEQLRALKQLSKIKDDKEGKAYLYEYIRLSDSLIATERANRNKFARIQFETNQYIKETKRLSTQNILISTIAASVILSLGLLFFVKQQRSKNNKLVFESEQQLANQEIYNLLLNQQTKLEEGRLLERHRIAEDMHDGILSHLFGTRMGMGFLDIKGDETTLKQYNAFIKELQKVEEEIRDVSHELKQDKIFSKNNFETILEQFLDQQSLLGGFNYSIVVETPSVFQNIQDTNKVVIYRIIQESVQNIIKHAKAKQITVSFNQKENTLNIAIKDNGIGFNSNKKYQGIGLKNIKSRVSKLQGTFNLQSKINKGTTINISIPNPKNG
ncbi:sensor histidine kinase [Postechiella marina]|uniref:Oxygen sensor histidine kinase NreB n=1 Tax=Postechiella marina TaxID=943941 RepID=A0ABP8C5Q9_9FLAO